MARSGCGGFCIICFLCVAINFLISFVIGIFVSWINVRTVTTGTTCYIQNFYVTALNKTAVNSTAINNQTNSIYFVLKFVNEQEYMGIYYDDLNLTFSYGTNKSLQIASYADDGFHQSGQDNTYTRDHVEITGGVIPWETLPRNGSKVDFRVDLETAVRFSEMFFRSKRHRLQIRAIVEVNDTTGLKVNKKAIKLKSGALRLHQYCAHTGLFVVLTTTLVLLFGT